MFFFVDFIWSLEERIGSQRGSRRRGIVSRKTFKTFLGFEYTYYLRRQEEETGRKRYSTARIHNISFTI